MILLLIRQPTFTILNNMATPRPNARFYVLNQLNEDVISIFRTEHSYGIITKKSIQLYNGLNDTWQRQLLPDNVTLMDGILVQNISLFDAKTQQLYYKDNYNQLALKTWNLNNNEYNSIRCTVKSNLDAKLLLINDELHLTGGYHGVHHIYNPMTKRYSIKHANGTRVPGIINQTAIYLKLKQKIYLLGGCQAISFASVQYILSYCMKTNKWTRLLIDLPMKMYDFAVSSVCNDRYLIICGGECNIGRGSSSCPSNTIFVMDVECFVINKCKIKCPARGSMRSIAFDNEQKMGLITFGFIRNLWKNKAFKNMIYLPVYLIELVQIYAITEELHLFWGNLHWTIQIDDILNNTNFD